MRYADMERLDLLLGHLKAFATTRPMAYGAPVCAVVGALAGLAMQTGPQDGPYQPDMEPARSTPQAMAEPISYPSGTLPDYVVGTDFLKATQPPPAVYASYEPPPLPPPPELPPYAPARPAPPLVAEGARWASEHGDILNVSLPEDHPSAPADNLMLADAAATGMTSR
ncbi:hypothetical protein J2X45_002952 [Caulobacter sp. BE264]|uniref:hypothetical protein n=1 Tax=Caulobacter sp. BE264 TaxID=2817724 RepID=UPI002866946C|nr:hypothetical protein [Caulobacter sp. BE264]MDR7231849.1 hypothetical protein [Caulobacter sp. BE264]